MGPIYPVPGLPAPPAQSQWSQGLVPSHPFPDKGRGKPAFPWHGNKGFFAGSSPTEFRGFPTLMPRGRWLSSLHAV